MRYLILLPLMLLGACASPDVGAFKQSTLALTTGMNENQAAFVQSSENILAKLDDGQSTAAQLSKIKTSVSTIKSHGADVEAATVVLAAYASSVADLASSGADGADAAQSMITNLTTAVSSLTGNASSVPSMVDNVTNVLGLIVTQKQNKKLYEIMDDVDEKIDEVAAKLGSAANGEISMVNSMATQWGLGRKGLRRHHESYVNLKSQAAELDAVAGDHIAGEVANCDPTAAAGDADYCDYTDVSTSYKAALAATAKKRSEILTLMNEIQAHEDNFQTWQKEIVAWKAQSTARVSGIPAMANAWQKDHAAILEYLKVCTKAVGFFNSKCGAFSAANLELFGALIGKAAFPF